MRLWLRRTSSKDTCRSDKKLTAVRKKKVYAVVNFLSFVFIAVFVPETKGKCLEETSDSKKVVRGDVGGNSNGNGIVRVDLNEPLITCLA